MTDLPPQVLHPMVLAWACKSRAHCCRDWRVDVPPTVMRQMAAACASSGDRQALRRLELAAAERGPEGTCALPLRDDGSCMFLEDRLCSFRLAHGVETLPVSCRKFPSLGLWTPRRLLLGLSFACPTAAELLASEGHGAILEDARPASPTHSHCDFRGDAPEDDASPACRFWADHWSLHRLFARLGGSPEERLAELARRATGQEPAAVELAPSFWSRPVFDPDLARPLLAAVARACPTLEPARAIALLRLVCDDGSPGILPEGLADAPADDVLLHRYLEQRLLVPEFLMTGASHLRLLATLFGAAARFRVERGRGATALGAIIQLDRMILHSNWVPALFAEGRDEMEVLRALASLACAWRAPAELAGGPRRPDLREA